MKDNHNEIWEVLLKTAVIENSYHEIEEYPTVDELSKIQLPVRYDRKMRNLLKRCAYHKKLKAFLRYAWKAAVFSFAVLGIAFVIFIQFDEVRAACQNVITYVYEEFFQFDFISSEDDEGSLELGFVPEGFVLEEMEKDESGTYILYKDAFERKIKVSYFVNSRTIYMDNEQYLVSNIQVNGVEGKLFVSKENGFDNYIVWNTEKGYFTVSSSLDTDVLLKIAENIK